MCRRLMERNISLILVIVLLFSIAAPVIASAEKEAEVDAKITVRIESDDKTIIPPTEVHIDSLDLSDYPGINKGAQDYDTLKPIHAIIKALEANEIDPKDHTQFEIAFGGNYIVSIAGLGEFDKGPFSGWMYFVDNKYADRGVGEFEISHGQEVVMFYTTNYLNFFYSWFENTEISVEEGQEVVVKLNGAKGGFGVTDTEPIENAVILINDEELKVDGKLVVTNQDGEARFKLDETGNHHISAKFKDNQAQLIRPYAVVEVKEIEEENPTIKSIKPVDEIRLEKVVGIEEINKLLPKTTIITDSSGAIHTVELIWEIKEQEEGYKAIGKFHLPKGVKQSQPKTKLEVRTNIILENKIPENDIDLNEALEKTLKYYKNNPARNPDSDWESFVGLWGAGMNLTENEYEWRNIDPGFNQITYGNEHVRYIFSLLSIGEDPSNIWGGRNLFKELLSHLEQYNGQFGTIGKHIFAIKALDIGQALGLDVGKWDETNKEIAISWLLSEQKDDGSFHNFSKLDHTGWALMALSNYRDRDDVDEAIEKALNYLEESQIDSGSFVDNSGWGSGENSNTNACVIQGLVAVGEDVTDPNGRWSKNGNTPIDGLLQFQQKDGAFWWELNNQGDLNMATKQSLIALVDIVKGKSTWKRMEDEVFFPAIGLENVKEINKQVKRLPRLDEVNIEHRNHVFSLYNMYMGLPEEYKLMVEDAELIIALKEAIEEKQNQVEEINGAIWDLPGDINDIGLEHKEAVLAIMEMYNSLSQADKKYVDYYSEVVAAFEKIKALEANESNDLENDKDIEDDEEKIDEKLNEITDEKEDNKKQPDNEESIIEGQLSSNPQTGDKGILVYLAIFILSSLSLAYMLLIRKES